MLMTQWSGPIGADSLAPDYALNVDFVCYSTFCRAKTGAVESQFVALQQAINAYAPMLPLQIAALVTDGDLGSNTVTALKRALEYTSSMNIAMAPAATLFLATPTPKTAALYALSLTAAVQQAITALTAPVVPSPAPAPAPSTPPLDPAWRPTFRPPSVAFPRIPGLPSTATPEAAPGAAPGAAPAASGAAPAPGATQPKAAEATNWTYVAAAVVGGVAVIGVAYLLARKPAPSPAVAGWGNSDLRYIGPWDARRR